MKDKVLIKQFKNKAKKPVAGLTPEHAVYDANGVRLDAKLGNINLQEFRDAQTEGVRAVREAAKQYDHQTVINNGTITNAADEEDITVRDNVLSLKDRTYIEGVDEMGYVILRKNKSFAEQVTKANTIYEIRYKFSLDEDITIPANCVLKFNGGSISGEHTIIGNNTAIDAKPVIIFGSFIKFSGTWNVPIIYDKWFEPSINDLKNAINELCNDDIQNTLIIDNNHVCDFIGDGDWALLVKSNTEIILNGSITINPNYLPFYNIINIKNKENVIVRGSGSIIGDNDTHIYDNPDHPGTHEWGYGVYVYDSSNIIIEGIIIANCTGDGIYLQDNSSVSIFNTEVYGCGRAGISCTTCNAIIKNNKIHNISRTNPKSGISLECESRIYDIKNVIIEGNEIYEVTNGIELIPNSGEIHNVKILNNTIYNCFTNVRTWYYTDGGKSVNNILFSNNYIYNSAGGANLQCLNLEKSQFVSNQIIGSGKITFDGCDNVLFDNNFINIISDIYTKRSNITISNCSIIHAVTSFGVISISDMGGSETIIPCTNPHVTFMNNVIQDYIFIDFVDFCVIKNNTIKLSDNATMTLTSGASGIVFADNHIEVKAQTANTQFINTTQSLKGACVCNNTYKTTSSIYNFCIPSPKTYYNNNLVFTSDDGIRIIDTVSSPAAVNSTNIEGFSYYDSTNGKPIFRHGNNWVDAIGTPV